MWPDVLTDHTINPDDVDDDNLLAEWEADFIASVGAQEFEPTERQEAKLAEIEDAIVERRARLTDWVEQEDAA